MFLYKNKSLPIIITVMMIVVIICLFATVKQPLVVCEKKVTSELNVTVSEVLETTLDSDEIRKMFLVKTIILPDSSNDILDNVVFSLEKAYQYLGNDKFMITKSKNSVVVKVEVSHDETIILDNIRFYDNNGLQMKINSNTKSSDVLTLKIDDNYSEGEFMTRLKKNGYSCK